MARQSRLFSSILQGIQMACIVLLAVDVYWPGSQSAPFLRYAVTPLALLTTIWLQYLLSRARERAIRVATPPGSGATFDRTTSHAAVPPPPASGVTVTKPAPSIATPASSSPSPPKAP